MRVGKAFHRAIYKIANLSKSVTVISHTLEALVCVSVAGGIKYVEIMASGVLGAALFVLVIIEIEGGDNA